jgi:hypothetical protein
MLWQQHRLRCWTASQPAAGDALASLVSLVYLVPRCCMYLVPRCCMYLAGAALRCCPCLCCQKLDLLRLHAIYGMQMSISVML